VIRSVRSWRNGTYTIVADYLPKREEGTLFPLQQIIVELIVTEQDRSEFERALDGGSAVFKKAADFDSHYKDLGLNEDADAVAKEIDGERTASEVASFAGRDAFNVFKLLHAFAVLGLIERLGKPQPTLQFAPTNAGDELLSTAGVADADDVWKPTTPGVVPIPPAAAGESDVSEFGDAPTLEIPVMSLPPDPPARQRSVEVPSPAQPRRATQTQARAPRPTLTSPGTKKNPGSSRGPLMVVLLLLLVGGGVYAGWQWWQKRPQEAGGSAPTKTVSKTAIPPTLTFVPSMTSPSVATSPGAAPPASATLAAELQGATQKPETSTQNRETSTQKTETIAQKPAAVTQKAETRPKANAASATGAPVPPKSTPVTVKAPATKLEPPPSTPVTRVRTGDKYADMARDYERTANGTHTVQFELVCQSASLGKAIDEGGAKVWFVPITYRGQSCYRVFWGRYKTREAAALAVGSIPRALRGPAPAIVRVP
jgi:hypothetical protein